MGMKRNQQYKQNIKDSWIMKTRSFFLAKAPPTDFVMVSGALF